MLNFCYFRIFSVTFRNEQNGLIVSSCCGGGMVKKKFFIQAVPPGLPTRKVNVKVNLPARPKDAPPVTPPPPPNDIINSKPPSAEATDAAKVNPPPTSKEATDAVKDPAKLNPLPPPKQPADVVKDPAKRNPSAKDSTKDLKPYETNWHIDSELRIINMNIVPCTKDIIMGDRIISIDGKIPISATEATTALMPGDSPRTVQLVVERRQNAVPMTNDRLKQIKHPRLEGFAYFVVNCINKQKLAKGSLGFSLSATKNKAYIMSVESGSIAAQHFGVGDTLLDIDGIPFPVNDASFLIRFSQSFFGKGGFTAVVERPTTPQRIEQFCTVYRLMLPQKSEDDNKMGADAIKIGMEAAAMHHLVFRKAMPKSCLTADIVNAPANTTTTTMDEPDTRQIRIATSSVSTVIGSDVDEGEELRKVERKSHAKDEMDLDDL